MMKTGQSHEYYEGCRDATEVFAQLLRHMIKVTDELDSDAKLPKPVVAAQTPLVPITVPVHEAKP